MSRPCSNYPRIASHVKWVTQRDLWETGRENSLTDENGHCGNDYIVSATFRKSTSKNAFKGIEYKLCNISRKLKTVVEKCWSAIFGEIELLVGLVSKLLLVWKYSENFLVDRPLSVGVTWGQIGVKFTKCINHTLGDKDQNKDYGTWVIYLLQASILPWQWLWVLCITVIPIYRR